MLARQIPALCPDCALSAFEWCHRHLVLNETKYKVQNNNRKEKKSIRRVYINSAWHKNGTFSRLLYPRFLLWLIPSLPGHWALGGRSPLSRAASWLCRFLSRLYGKSGISFITKVPDRWLFPERIVLSAPWSNGASFRTRFGGRGSYSLICFRIEESISNFGSIAQKKKKKKKKSGCRACHHSGIATNKELLAWFHDLAEGNQWSDVWTTHKLKNSDCFHQLYRVHQLYGTLGKKMAHKTTSGFFQTQKHLHWDHIRSLLMGTILVFILVHSLRYLYELICVHIITIKSISLRNTTKR